MSNLVNLVEALEIKVNKLLEKQNQMAQEVADLQSLLNESKAQNAQLEKSLEDLENKNQSLKTANAMLGSNEYKKETKQRINALIREIDHCIVQLSD